MHALRHAHILSRLVLVWFVLFVGASLASPWIKPSTVHMVCAGGGGMKLVASGNDGADVQVSSGMDCPLCAPMGLALPSRVLAVEAPSTLSYALQPIAAAHIAWVTGAPLPPRGPPSFS